MSSVHISIIKIYDSYELSKQYNLKNLFDEYYEIILEFLKKL